MTTIICSSRQKMLLADSYTSYGDNCSLLTAEKIWHHPDYGIFAASGNLGEGILAFEWIVAGSPVGQRPSLKEATLIQLTKSDSKVFMYGDPCIALCIEAEPYAYGAGGEFALGAMAAGATPMEAMLVAAKLNPYTRPPFRSMRYLDDGSIERKAYGADGREQRNA